MATGTLTKEKVQTKNITVSVTAGSEGYVALADYGIPSNSVILGIRAKNATWIHVRLYSNRTTTNCRLTKYDADTTPAEGNYNLTVAYIEI